MSNYYNNYLLTMRAAQRAANRVMLEREEWEKGNDDAILRV